MNNSVIIDGGRSPIGLKNGKLLGMRSDDLCADIIKQIIAKNDSVDNSLYEDLVLGCAFPEGSQGMLISKGVAILANLPTTIGAKVVNNTLALITESGEQSFYQRAPGGDGKRYTISDVTKISLNENSLKKIQNALLGQFR